MGVENSYRRLYSIDTQLYKVTGVEKVMLDIHHAVKDEFNAKIVGTIPYERVNAVHNISEDEYVKFSNPFMFNDSIVVVHERRLLILFWLLKYILFQRIEVVYVHHNIFHNHKLMTILPKTIVAIADEGIRNLTEFFGASIDSIHKIHNCVVDSRKGPHPLMNRDKISILLPGRINSQKQQVEIVRQLRGKLDSRIRICFAGDGPELEDLERECHNDPQFEVLGFRADVHDLMRKNDFVLLYSVHEGLPIALIEATMIGVPIICNNVGGNSEICHSGKNGWLLETWDELVATLNHLPDISNEEYASMCQEGRKVYEEKFAYDIFKDKYLRLLKSL